MVIRYALVGLFGMHWWDCSVVHVNGQNFIDKMLNFFQVDTIKTHVCIVFPRSWLKCGDGLLMLFLSGWLELTLVEDPEVNLS